MRVAVEVYYRKAPLSYEDVIAPSHVCLNKSHALVHAELVEWRGDEDRAVFLERLFERFNKTGESNPLTSARAQDFLKRARLRTSMSAGDVVRIACAPHLHELWYCAEFGFERVTEVLPK